MYECHLTFEPVEGELLSDLKAICLKYKFRVADLIMVKNRQATPERSNRDTFCTGHATTERDMFERMVDLHRDVEKSLGIKVWRRKIEHIILDERFT